MNENFINRACATHCALADRDHPFELAEAGADLGKVSPRPVRDESIEKLLVRLTS
jgi:hypothetical protein